MFSMLVFTQNSPKRQIGVPLKGQTDYTLQLKNTAAKCGDISREKTALSLEVEDTFDERVNE